MKHKQYQFCTGKWWLSFLNKYVQLNVLKQQTFPKKLLKCDRVFLIPLNDRQNDSMILLFVVYIKRSLWNLQSNKKRQNVSKEECHLSRPARFTPIISKASQNILHHYKGLLSFQKIGKALLNIHNEFNKVWKILVEATYCLIILSF